MKYHDLCDKWKENYKNYGEFPSGDEVILTEESESYKMEDGPLVTWDVEVEPEELETIKHVLEKQGIKSSKLLITRSSLRRGKGVDPEDALVLHFSRRGDEIRFKHNATARDNWYMRTYSRKGRGNNKVYLFPRKENQKEVFEEDI